jgi:2-keto-4-pentenoate hydratase
MTDRLQQMAQWMWDARQRRLPYDNLPGDLTPASIAEAYAAQEIYYRLAEPVYGAVGGAKIATTTKVMQELMGINHACGGAIFSRTIHASPAKITAADFVNLAHRERDRTQARRRPAGARARRGRARLLPRPSRARCRRSS